MFRHLRGTACQFHDGSGSHGGGRTALGLTSALGACQGGIVGNDHAYGGCGEQGHDTVPFRNLLFFLHGQQGGGKDAAASCCGGCHNPSHGRIELRDSQGPVQGAGEKGTGQAFSTFRYLAHLKGAAAGQSAGAFEVFITAGLNALCHDLVIFPHVFIYRFLSLFHLFCLLP